MSRPVLRSATVGDRKGIPWTVEVLGPDPDDPANTTPVITIAELLDPERPSIEFPMIELLMALAPPGFMATTPDAAMVITPPGREGGESENAEEHAAPIPPLANEVWETCPLCSERVRSTDGYDGMKRHMREHV